MTNINVFDIFCLFIIQVRKRNISKGKRKILHSTKALSVSMNINPLFENISKGTPHVLLQLSVRSFKRYQSNSNELKDVSVKDGEVSYNNVIYGVNLKGNGGQKVRKRMNLNKI